MREIRIYLALLALVIWVSMATYWISSRMCVDFVDHRNNTHPKTYQEKENIPFDEADGLLQTVQWIK